jgi:dTDP-4-amino-4,6-dideoxygalactose transaminase
MAGTTETPTLKVPFVDLGPSHETVRSAILRDVDELLETGAFTNGPAVARFEEAFAGYCGTDFCVGVASGLDALRLGLQSLSIQPGLEVIVPAHTFIATWEAVSQVGATPIPVDATETDWNLDPDAVAASISARTGAVMPVHLYGQMADMAALTTCVGHVPILEDAAQAHGATRDGRRAGAVGTLAGFSFYPGKNLGAIGDAGAIVTDAPDLALQIKALREHGQARKYHHEEIGWTSRLDTIQALALLHKLELLDAWNDQRRVIAAAYSASLVDVGDLVLPPVPDGSDPVWHLYVVRTADPDDLSRWLSSHGIASGRHYPQPPHLSEAYRFLGHSKGAFPVAEAIANSAISLPIFPGMTLAQVEQVVDATKRYFDRG